MHQYPLSFEEFLAADFLSVSYLAMIFALNP